MNKTTIEMLKIYKPISNLDWLNYKLVKKDVTFHHIIKSELGGKRVVTNGALLMPVATCPPISTFNRMQRHRYLHSN